MNLLRILSSPLTSEKISSIFQNHNMDVWQNNILVKTMNINKKVIKGKPTIQYFIQKYRGYEILKKGHNKSLYKFSY